MPLPCPTPRSSDLAAPQAAAPADIFPGAALAAAARGFLYWNWAPSRLFLGDVGSVPLGYLLGSLLIGAAAGGQWAAAVVLPLYYLADASLPLVRRAWRRDRKSVV